MKTLHTIYSTFAKHNMASLRLLLVMFLTLTVTTNAWADYTIAFKSTDGADGSAAQTTIANLISSGGTNVSTISATRAYNGKSGYGIKLGSSSAVGNVSMTLANSAQIKASKLVVKAAYYDSNKTLKVTVTYTDNTTTTQTITPASSLTDYDVSLTDTKTIKQIKIESVTASKGRMYCHSIKVVAASAAVTTYTVTYDLNGGTGTTPTQANVAAGGTFTLAASSGFSKAGYSFAGWNDGTTTYNASATYTMPAKAVTLKAQWTALPKYTVTLVPGSGSVTDTELEEPNAGDGVTLPTPTLDGCDEWSFAGWTTSSVANETSSKPATLLTGTYKPTSNITLYAVYQRTEETEGGGSTTEQTTKTYTFSDYTAGTQYAENEVHKLDDDVTLTTTDCHFTSELRIYSSSTYNGYVVSNQLPGRIISIGFNAGNKVDKIAVYGSTNGTAWTEVGQVSVTSTSYANYSLSFGETNYTYFKLDVVGSNQVRLKSITITWESTSAGGTTTTYYYHSTPECATQTALSVTYNGNGNTSGSVPTDAIEYKKDDQVTVLGNTGNLAKTGYTFSGWNTEADGTGTQYAAGATFTITENTTLYAQWTAYTVTWTISPTTGGSLSATSGNSITVTPNAAYTYASPAYKVTSGSATVSKSGDTFTATPSANCTIQINMVEKPKYTVTFNAGSNGTCSTTSLTETSANAGVKLPDVTPNAGYSFLGWATTNSATTANAGTAGATYKPTSNITLYAVYKQLHTITWMVGSASVLTEEVANATGVTQTPADNPANNAIGDCANAFVGWSEKSAGSTPQNEAYYDDLCTAAQMKSKYTSVTSDKTFYAVFATAEGDGSAEGWTLTSNGLADLTSSDVFVFAVSVSGTYYAMPNDGGTSSSPKLTEITVANNKITSEVGNQLKWNISGNATNGYIFYPDGSTTKWMYCNTTTSSSNNDNIRVGTGTRKAWKQNSSTKYLYNDDNTTRYLSRNGTTDFRSYTSTNTNPIVPKVFKYNAGTTYSNYVTNCCALATVTNLTVSGTTAKSATLTWTAPSPTTGITKLQVRDENGNVKVDNLAANATTATITELSECTEYTFCIASVGDECELTSQAITAQPFSGAKTVTFNPNGGVVSPTSFTTSCDKKSTTLPTPTYSGYRFMGWYTEANGGILVNENPYSPDADITLHAHWAKEYSVTYNANGGSTSCTSGNYIAGETVTLCTSTPSKTGYTFAGWTYSPEVTITDGKFTMPASDVTITAQWTINSYTVTWKPNGGKWGESTENIVHTYEYGATITKPDDPRRDGYRFIGWNTTIASTMPANNITYTAQWKQNYTITFHDGDDTTPWTQTIDAESIDLNTYIGTHACGEYNFAGWSTDATQYNDQTANITTWVMGTYTPTANIHLYAVYVKGDLATDFTLNCDGGVYEIWENGTDKLMAGRQNGGGDKFYTTEYWDANYSESNGAPFTITKVADNTYKLQNADGQYITGNSYDEDDLNIEDTWENADKYKWTISAGSNGTWRFTNKVSTNYALIFYDKYFQLRKATNVTFGSDYYDLELTPAQTNVYQSNPNCGPYTITFETGGGKFIQGNYKYSTKKTSNLTEPTISQFPAAELDGYTFAGWKDGSPQEDINYEPYLKKEDDNLVVSSNKTYHAVYYYYDEEEEIDWSEEFTTGMYAEVNGTKYFLSGTPNRGTMSSTTDCGYVSEVTITPGTGANAGKYKISVNGVGMAPIAGETDLVAGTAWWTITETSAGSGEYKISGETNRNVVLNNSSFGHYAYNAQGSYNGNYHYPSFGKCLEHHWTSNPPIKLTVTYDPNGATSGTAPVDDNYYQIGGKVYVLGSNDLQKANYAFAGWNTQADGLGENYEEGEDFNITKNTTLYAKWDCATYVNITKGTPVNGTFNLSVTGTQYTCEDGFVVSVTDIVPATGYRFDHITQEGVDAANVEINNDDKTVTYKQLSNGSSTINVVFAAIPYTVTWDPNGGNWGGSTDSKVDTYNYGASITRPADPTRTGYTFAGWSPTPASSMPAENVTYTAQWTANTNTPYVVEHYQQNLDLSYTTPTEKESFTGTTDTKVTPTVKTYEGFTSPATQEVTIAADGNLVVRYEYKRNSYQLTWDLAGGTITAAGTDAGSVLFGAEIKAPRVAKVDNVFMGWEPEVPATMPAHDATYVAQWIELTNFRTSCENIVIWNANGGEWADGTTADIVDAYTRGQEIVPPTHPTLEGWKFMGWDPEFVAGTTMQGEDLTYVAQWAKAYTVTYDANGGYTACEDNNQYAADEIVTLCNNRPTKAGYTFAGWMRNDNSAILQPNQTFAMPENDVTLIAQWTPNTDTKYVVEHYQQNLDGTYPATPTEREELAGTTDTQVTPAVKAYAGFTAPAPQQATIAATGSLVVKYEYTRNSYNLAWDLNGGTVTTEGTAAGSIKFGAPITAPVVEKVGHNFEGWEDQDGNPVTITTMPAKDATYKAIWEVASHKVTWDPAGGHWDGDHNKKEETYEYGAEIVKPANPEKTGYAFIGWQPEVEEIMQNSDLTYTAQWGEEFCDNYSFHWGTGTEDQVRNDNDQACFTQKDDTHEWQVTHFTIPADTKYFVGLYGWWYWSDLGVGDSNGQKSKSVMKEWTETGDQVMYLAHVGRGYTLGHAVGAVGTLRIYDNSSMDNLDVAFIPNGYGITLTSNSSSAKTAYAFRTTTVDHKWETDVLKMPGITNNKYTVGLATQVDNEYVASNHSKAPENLEKMGVTEVVAGKKMIYLKPNTDWKKDGARFAAYFFGNGEKWISMTDPDGDGIYECEKPDGYTTVIFCRMKPDATANNWDNKWNQTQDIILTSDGLAKLYTITGWDSSCTGPTNMQPKTDTNGKFRMWDNSTNKNWFVHFVPYYLLSYNANGGEGEMPATEYNTEDPNKEVTVSANGFTRTGYDFVSWNTKADGTGTSYQPGDAYTMTGDATLYAIWKAQDYQITYKDQGDEDYSGSNEAELPKTHTYGKATELVDGEKIGYTFEGWYDNPDCTGDAITKLGAKDYTADITLYAKWTFAMEYDITNTETIYITSAKKQTVKATTQLTLQVGNMPVGTTIDIAAPHITFYDDAGKPVTQLTTKYNPETFSLAVAYTPEDENTTEQPTITLSVLGHEKAFDIISVRSLPATFAIVAKVGSMWYALPSQGLSSTSDLVGYPVEVDNQDDPTTVTRVPANADWSLYGVYQSSGSNDRFAANGGNILFVNGEANALNASRKDGYVLTEAGYGSYQTTTSPDLYEWKPTTTDLETYQLTNANRTDRNLSIDILTRFGVYKGEIENLRFLPIKERYTLASFQVVEWKENSLVIMYNGNPAQTATIAIDGTTNIGSANLSDVNKDFAIYELPAAGLVNNATKRILITIGTEQKWLTVPYIISGEKTDAEVVASTSADIVTATDVFILKGAKFTATATSKNSQYRFRNVTVYGGGKLVIGSGKFLSMNSIILRAGGITDAGEYDYVYPQFDFQGTLTNSAGEFKYDYITDYEHWYHLVLPFDGKIKSPSIKYPVEFYGNNVSATNSGSWVVKRYDGATRATGNYDAWVDIETEGKDVITAGHGYIYWGAPKKVKVNGEEKRQKWGIQRIVMEKGWEAARDAEIGNKTISGLGSYANVDNNSGNVYDQGWNLIGNPYMVNLTGLNSKSLKTGKLIEELNANGNWTGGWVLDSINATLRYITVPSDHFEWYEAKRVTKNMELSTGRTFFVQIDGTATDVMFEAANRAQLMPSLLAANNNPVDIETGIVLSNETMQDEVNFWIAEGMTNDYEYNADYPKTLNTTNFNVYGVHTNGYLSWVAISPEIAAESMPIGYQVPAAGTYVLSVSEEYYSEEIDALLVTDHEVAPEVTTDLMIAPYEFSVNQAETNNKRFTVSVKLKTDDSNDATGLDNMGVGNEQLMKFIYQDKIFILHQGVIYDATGKRVITINK